MSEIQQTEPIFELTDEMIECIKTEIIPSLSKHWGINSSAEYQEANDEYEVDNVDLFQDLCYNFPADEVLKINKNDFKSEDEYDEERERKWDETFYTSERQLQINLGIEYLEDNEW